MAPVSELHSVTCHMGSHSVTCCLTQVNVPHLNPSHTGCYMIYLLWSDRRLSWPCCWFFIEVVYLFADDHLSSQ